MIILRCFNIGDLIRFYLILKIQQDINKYVHMHVIWFNECFLISFNHPKSDSFFILFNLIWPSPCLHCKVCRLPVKSKWAREFFAQYGVPSSIFFFPKCSTSYYFENDFTLFPDAKTQENKNKIWKLMGHLREKRYRRNVKIFGVL